MKLAVLQQTCRASLSLLHQIVVAAGMDPDLNLRPFVTNYSWSINNDQGVSGSKRDKDDRGIAKAEVKPPTSQELTVPCCGNST